MEKAILSLLAGPCLFFGYKQTSVMITEQELAEKRLHCFHQSTFGRLPSELMDSSPLPSAPFSLACLHMLQADKREYLLQEENK